MTKTFGRIAAALLGASAAIGSANAAVQGVARIEVTLTDASSSRFLQVAEVVALSGGVDVALNGTATATASSAGFGTNANAAIDGDTDGRFRGTGIFHSARGDAAPTLTIDFGGAVFDLDALTLFGRSDNCCVSRDVFTVALFALDGTTLFTQTNLIANGGAVSAALPATAVPLPAAAFLFAPAIGGLALAKRRKA